MFLLFKNNFIKNPFKAQEFSFLRTSLLNVGAFLFAKNKTVRMQTAYFSSKFAASRRVGLTPGAARR